jgi:hypothetical protein
MEPVSSCVCLVNVITETSIESITNACIIKLSNFWSSQDVGNNNQLASKSEASTSDSKFGGLASMY